MPHWRLSYWLRTMEYQQDAAACSWHVLLGLRRADSRHGARLLLMAKLGSNMAQALPSLAYGPAASSCMLQETLQKRPGSQQCQ